MRLATDTDFNKADRYLEFKLDIYFDSVPLTVTQDNYLIDATWLEETVADTSTPLIGEASSNELSFRLYNFNKIFSPTNHYSPYHNKIKLGVKVVPYIRPKDKEVVWLALGEYYVTAWDTTITDTFVDVTANDIWHNILNSPLSLYSITTNISYYNLLTTGLTMMGYTASVDAGLTEIIPFAYINSSAKEFIKGIVAACLAYATSDRNGNPIIRKYTSSGTIRATLTDNDQLKVLNVKQSILKAYNGVQLSYSIPSISEDTELINITNKSIPSGDTTLTNLQFSNSPLWDISYVHVEKAITIGYEARQGYLDLTVNSGAAATINIKVVGKYLQFTTTKLEDSATKLLAYSNNFIQTSSYAATFKGILKNYLDLDIPIMVVEIRGNPLFNLGDKLTIISDRYDTAFTGLISRMTYKFTGGLSCTLVLLNENIF